MNKKIYVIVITVLMSLLIIACGKEEIGTSILYMPEKEPGSGAGMFMIYTEDIEDVEPLKTKVSNK